ncbi:MAG TPA: YCF48-related protein [Flavipsychrobacter sp.]
MKIYLNIFAALVCVSIAACNKNRIEPADAVKIETGTTARLNRVQFINDSVCIAVGGERFFTAEMVSSYDGGSSWVKTSHPDAGKGLYGMTASGNTVYACGVDGKLMTSKDAGKNWALHQMNYWRFFNSVAVASGGERIMVSTDGQNTGTVFRIDAGNNLIDTAYFKFGLNDIAMPTPTTGYLAGFGAVLKTTDGGATWNYLDVKNDNFMSVYSLNENELWVVGYRGTIFHTSDGGANWDKLRNGNQLIQKNYLMLDVLFKDASTGWICGEEGLLLQTTNGGKDWKQFNKFTENALRDMTLTPDGNLIVVGDGGTMYKVHLN